MNHDPMVLVGREKVVAIEAAWLRDARWVMREKGSGTRSTIEEDLRAFGVDPADLTVALTLPSNEAVATAAEAGAGIAALSRLVCARALQTGDLVELPFSLPDRAFYALRHKDAIALARPMR